MKDMSLPIAILLGLCVFAVVLGILIMKNYFDKYKL
jgi:hypothetical protein